MDGGLSAEDGGKKSAKSKEEGPRRARCNAGGGLWAFLLAGPVTERRVAACDANRVELAGAELLVARGSDKTGSRRGAGLAVVHP